MVAMDQDPWDWSVDQVVHALCGLDGRLMSENSVHPDPRDLERRLRNADYQGRSLLRRPKASFWRTEFNIRSIGLLDSIVDLVRTLQDESPKYQQWAARRQRNSTSQFRASFTPISHAPDYTPSSWTPVKPETPSGPLQRPPQISDDSAQATPLPKSTEENLMLSSPVSNDLLETVPTADQNPSGRHSSLRKRDGEVIVEAHGRKRRKLLPGALKLVSQASARNEAQDFTLPALTGQKNLVLSPPQLSEPQKDDTVRDIRKQNAEKLPIEMTLSSHNATEQVLPQSAQREVISILLSGEAKRMQIIDDSMRIAVVEGLMGKAVEDRVLQGFLEKVRNRSMTESEWTTLLEQMKLIEVSLRKSQPSTNSYIETTSNATSKSSLLMRHFNGLPQDAAEAPQFDKKSVAEVQIDKRIAQLSVSEQTHLLNVNKNNADQNARTAEQKFVVNSPFANGDIGPSNSMLNYSERIANALEDNEEAEVDDYLGKSSFSVNSIFYDLTPLENSIEQHVLMKNIERKAITSDSDQPRPCRLVKDTLTVFSLPFRIGIRQRGRRIYVNRRMKHFLLANNPRHPSIYRRDNDFQVGVIPYPTHILRYTNHTEIASMTISSVDGSYRMDRGQWRLETSLERYAREHQDDEFAKYDKYIAAAEEEGSDDMLPAYGDSGSENEYGTDIEEEMEEEKEEKEEQEESYVIQYLDEGTIMKVLTDCTAQFEAKWRAEKLPLLERKAWSIWTSSRKRRTLKPDLEYRLSEIKRLEKRITRQERHILSDVFKSEEEIRRISELTHPSFSELFRIENEIEILERKNAPQKPAPRRKEDTKKQRQPNKKNSLEEEILSSEETSSDGDNGLSDFIVDDEAMPQNSRQQDQVLSTIASRRSSGSILQESEQGEMQTAEADEPVATAAFFANDVNSPSSLNQEIQADSLVKELVDREPGEFIVSDEQERDAPSDQVNTTETPATGSDNDDHSQHVEINVTPQTSAQTPLKKIDMVEPSPQVLASGYNDNDQELVDGHSGDDKRGDEHNRPIQPMSGSSTESPPEFNVNAPQRDKNWKNGPSDVQRIPATIAETHTPCNAGKDEDMVNSEALNNNPPRKAYKKQGLKKPCAENMPNIDDIEGIRGLNPKWVDWFGERLDRQRLLIWIVTRALPKSRSAAYSALDGKPADVMIVNVNKALMSLRSHSQRLRDKPEMESDGLMQIATWFVSWNLCIRLKSSDGIPKKKLDTAIQTVRNGTQDFQDYYDFLSGLLFRLAEAEAGHRPTSKQRKQSQFSIRRDGVSEISELSEANNHIRPRKRKRPVSESQQGKLLRLNAAKRNEETKRMQEAAQKQLRENFSSDNICKDVVVNLLRSEEAEEDPITINPHSSTRMHQHQVEGVQFMWREIVGAGEGCLLAHTMGLGKTMQVISLLLTIAEASSSPNEKVSKQIPEALKRSQTLILCPPALVNNWHEELCKWIPKDAEVKIGGIYAVATKRLNKEERIQEIEDWAENGGILLMGYKLFVAMIRNLPTGRSVDCQLTEQDRQYVENVLLQDTNLVVADEAQEFKNSSSILAGLMRRFETKSRIALTGSPLSNNLEEYYQIVNWVSEDYLGGSVEFRARFVEPIAAGLWQDATRGEQRTSLKMLKLLKNNLDPKVNRADYSRIRNRMPGKVEVVLRLPLTELQKQCYQAYIDSVRGKNLAEMPPTNLWVLIAVLRLLCNHPFCFYQKLVENSQSKKESAAEGGQQKPSGFKPDQISNEDKDQRRLVESENFIEEIDNLLDKPAIHLCLDDDVVKQQLELLPKDPIALRNLTLSRKMEMLMKIVELSEKVNDKVLVFSQSIPTLEYVREELRKTNRIAQQLDGQYDTSKRQKLTADFNTGINTVLLISTRAGGTGLNLQGSNRVVILDDSFNPMWEQQAIGRAYRIGQTKKVFVYRLVCAGTFEEALQNQSVFKLQLSSRIVDKKDTIRKAKKGAAQYLVPVADHPQESLDSFRGLDPDVLDHILDEQKENQVIRSIKPSESFMEEEKEDLTPEEEAEVKELEKQQKLRRENPTEYNASMRAAEALRQKTSFPVPSSNSNQEWNTVRESVHGAQEPRPVPPSSSALEPQQVDVEEHMDMSASNSEAGKLAPPADSPHQHPIPTMQPVLSGNTDWRQGGASLQGSDSSPKGNNSSSKGNNSSPTGKNISPKGISGSLPDRRHVPQWRPPPSPDRPGSDIPNLGSVSQPIELDESDQEGEAVNSVFRSKTHTSIATPSMRTRVRFELQEGLRTKVKVYSQSWETSLAKDAHKLVDELALVVEDAMWRTALSQNHYEEIKNDLVYALNTHEIELKEALQRLQRKESLEGMLNIFLPKIAKRSTTVKTEVRSPTSTHGSGFSHLSQRWVGSSNASLPSSLRETLSAQTTMTNEDCLISSNDTDRFDESNGHGGKESDNDDDDDDLGELEPIDTLMKESAMRSKSPQLNSSTNEVDKLTQDQEKPSDGKDGCIVM